MPIAYELASDTYYGLGVVTISVVLTGHMLETYLRKRMQTFAILFVCLIKTHRLAKCIDEARVDL